MSEDLRAAGGETGFSPCCRAAARIFSRVSSLTPGLPFSARETEAGETPNSWASLRTEIGMKHLLFYESIFSSIKYNTGGTGSQRLFTKHIGQKRRKSGY